MARISNKTSAAAVLAEENKKNATRKPAETRRSAKTKENTKVSTKAKKTNTETKAKTKKAKVESGEVTVEMIQAKETPGAFQFREVDDDGDIIEDFKTVKIGSIYLRKDALDGAAPEKISVTVTW